MLQKPLITFLTDFGTRDGYVGAVKGVIKSIAPEAEVIDISHEIKPFEVSQAAFSLLNYYALYPRNTIHLVVVDPGVGSERRPLILRTAHHYFIGPDNGIFRYILNREAYTAYEIEPPKIQGPRKSNTFHARDVFGPAAAQLACGQLPSQLGQVLDGFTELNKPPYRFEKDQLVVDLISIDHFGNVISGFSRSDLIRIKKRNIRKVQLKEFSTGQLKHNYSDAGVGNPLALWNSQDFLEVAVCQGSAARQLNVNINDDKLIVQVD